MNLEILIKSNEYNFIVHSLSWKVLVTTNMIKINQFLLKPERDVEAEREGRLTGKNF